MLSLHARPQPILRSWATGMRSRVWEHSGKGTKKGNASDVCERTPSLNSCIAFSLRWAKGGFLIEDARESRYETNVDYSFFTEPVSCEVYNKVGSTNVSTLVNVHCE